jgi:hypothetical protein
MVKASVETPGRYSLLSALVAVTAGFHPYNLDAETTLAFDLALKFLEKGTFKFLNTTTFEACQVNMTPTRLRLVKVLSALQMHEVKLVD